MDKISTEKMICRFLEQNRNYFCDDCLSLVLDIQPRQQVNQISNKLRTENFIIREKGICSECGRYKFVNHTSGKTDQFKEDSSTKNLNSRSRLNLKDFENEMAKLLGKKLGVELSEQSLLVGPEKHHKFDFVSSDRSIVVECKSYT